MGEMAVMVLTSKSLTTMFREGGAGNWKAKEESVRRCRWVVAVRNRHSSWSEGQEDHGTAFLIGRIVGVKQSLAPEDKGRRVIVFDRYAELNIPGVWPMGQRNPVAYTDLAMLNIDPNKLEWKSFSDTARSIETPSEPDAPSAVIEKARTMIARALSIDPSALTISINI